MKRDRSTFESNCPREQTRCIDGNPVGYACICTTLRKKNVFTSRTCRKKTLDERGRGVVGELALQNARDLLTILKWNEVNGIRFFRVSSDLIPWKTDVDIRLDPLWPEIKAALRKAGDYARQYDHRLTFHPDHFVKLASKDPAYAETSKQELEVHSMLLDEMGFDVASPWNKINIHLGGAYGDKTSAMRRWADRYQELSPRCRARVTVENDDRPNLFSVLDLMELHEMCGVPIVFDFHHHRFCDGGIEARDALDLAMATWPGGVTPVVHWSESQEGRKPHAHSDYVTSIDTLGRRVDVMIEAKMKEAALLRLFDDPKTKC
jgi:UV DNA damage endonuclease